MKCLIIAAGRGSRLSTEGDSKPLLPFMGLPIIERTIMTAKTAGLTDFYVVTGYNGEKVENFLSNLSKRRNLKITTIRNDEWKKENGLSILKARELLNENFILLMVDHIIDENIIKKLKNEEIQDDEVVLAVDYNTDSNTLVDIQDVTKVNVDNSKIINIGKNITEYNAYDTGVFLCSPAIFTAIETSIANNKESSLSGGIRVLTENRKAKTFDIENRFWIDVDDKKALKKAEKCLVHYFGKIF